MRSLSVLISAAVVAVSMAAATGECFSWTNGPNDPYRGMHDPDAGGWFPQLA